LGDVHLAVHDVRLEISFQIEVLKSAVKQRVESSCGRLLKVITLHTYM
jgi:hypothetical protein